MKIAVLALLYLSVPALMVPDQAIEKSENRSTVTVLYKSADTHFIKAAKTVDDVPHVVDDENCEEVLVDFEPSSENDVQRYTMLRAD